MEVREGTVPRIQSFDQHPGTVPDIMINLKNIKPTSVRKLEEMKDMVFDQKWLKKADLKTALYYVWRNVAENDQDKEKISQSGLRYDITEFAPLTLGKEFNKTFGHTHSLVPGSNLAYTEIYEVLEGEVYFLFQKFENDKIEDIFTVHCLTGDKYVIQPNYAHIMINPIEQKTIMANWLTTASQQTYEEIEEMKGGGYYAVKSEQGIQWVKNQTYSSVPQIRFVEPNNLAQFNISKEQSLYSLVNDLEKLDFLKNPQNFKWE